MVSPRKDHVDVENRTLFDFGVAPNLSGIKSNLLQKPSTLPLGDVRNTLGSAPARNVLKGLSDEVSNFVKKDSELKPSKSIPVPLNIIPETVEEKPDPVWDAPLAYRDLEEDTYCDIFPLSLRLTDEDIRRFVLNQPGPRLGPSLTKQIDDDDFLPVPEFHHADIYCEILGYEDILESDEDLSEVPPLDIDDFSDYDF
uniref:Uncharacterized protein n=1 Tax=Lygus hesperus TaxID=30085 RepID=A0A146KUM6_LYGHE